MAVGVKVIRPGSIACPREEAIAAGPVEAVIRTVVRTRADQQVVVTRAVETVAIPAIVDTPPEAGREARRVTVRLAPGVEAAVAEAADLLMVGDCL